MLRCGHFSVSGYGDLSLNFPVQIGKAARHQDADDLWWVGCNRMAPVSRATKRVKMHSLAPSAERNRYRC